MREKDEYIDKVRVWFGSVISSLSICESLEYYEGILILTSKFRRVFYVKKFKLALHYDRLKIVNFRTECVISEKTFFRRFGETLRKWGIWFLTIYTDI